MYNLTYQKHEYWLAEKDYEFFLFEIANLYIYKQSFYPSILVSIFVLYTLKGDHLEVLQGKMVW
jgi:hypothetical protein